MSKRLLIFISVSLLAINVYTIVNFYRLKKQNVTLSHQNSSENDELHAYQINFATNIRNSNIRLEEVPVKDSLSNVLLLKDVLKNSQEQILVCRFSELHCESCVNFSIQLFRHWADSIGKNNTLFLGSYRSNKIFNRAKPLYGIHNLNVYNVSELNIPAEELGFPYYFVLDSALRVTDVFVPDKAVPELTDKYLKMIHKRYFDKQE